jgi:hypothetical protein
MVLTKREALEKIEELQRYIEELEEEPSVEYYDGYGSWVASDLSPVDAIIINGKLFDADVIHDLNSNTIEYDHYNHGNILYRVRK